jgi:ankyrin repeat protein
MVENFQKSGKKFIYLTTLIFILAFILLLSLFKERKQEKAFFQTPESTQRQNFLKNKIDPEREKVLKEKEERKNKLALVIHAENCNLEKVKQLLSEGVNINCYDDFRMTPLHKSAEKGCLEVAEYLLENGAEVDSRDFVFQTPLFLAVEKNHLEMAKLLIKNGADINTYDFSLHRPLHFASQKNYEITKLLLESGADPNNTNQHGYAPIHYAALNGKNDIVELLILHHADVNLRDEKDYTALMAVASQEILKGSDLISTTKLLLEKGADPSIINKDGKTAYDYAKRLHPEIAELLKVETPKEN